MNTHRELAAALRDALNAEAQLPVPLQALIAGSVMCARGGAPSRLGMAKVGRYSYGSSQNHYADLLDAIVGRLPAVVAGMAAGGIDPATAARLGEEVRRRDETIAALRRELKALAERSEHVRRYALALHERVRTLEEQAAGEAGAGEVAGRTADGGC
ncbi:hypothetical protein [Arthrobacter mobilis]|uniref:Replication region DNA-binding N-term n=1 Tax=Arthrobacter mobilis TaxID=2724944 RepID=A0A7X6HDG8_9MICC|nr:hypothetical protein [Arthrobacter mobilis]NKX53627.1 hypothetical protein [Arthrobacter mobilis]